MTLNIRGYEKWGAPVGGCASFDNAHPIKKFNIDITVTNKTSKVVVDWYPTFLSNSGTKARTCYYPYGPSSGFPSIPIGDSRNVTFAAFVENNEYVSEMRMFIEDSVLRRCFSEGGKEIPC